MLPRATKVIAVTSGFSEIRQPKMVAMSPMRAVINPIIARMIKKDNQPPYHEHGGTKANRI